MNRKRVHIVSTEEQNKNLLIEKQGFEEAEVGCGEMLSYCTVSGLEHSLSSFA